MPRRERKHQGEPIPARKTAEEIRRARVRPASLPTVAELLASGVLVLADAEDLEPVGPEDLAAARVDPDELEQG
jgi:hypothetical protein